MKRPSNQLLNVIFSAIAASAGYFYFKKRRKSKKETLLIPEEPKKQEVETTPASSASMTDFKSKEHLLFCEESQLDRRIIQLENTINMRDIGGYTGLDGRKTKWGKIIRSEELNQLTDNDVAWLNDIGLKHIYDFRDEGKSLRTPDRVPESAEYHNLPSLSGMPVDIHQLDFTQPNMIDDFFKIVYGYQVEHKAQVFAEVLKTLAKDETPILYHCTNGKDRTGFMTALILLICGVPEETILSDYTLTNMTFDAAYRRFSPVMAKGLGVEPICMHDFFGVKPAWLNIQLDYIRNNYENVDAYLLDNTDLTQKDLDAVRNVMLES